MNPDSKMFEQELDDLLGDLHARHQTLIDTIPDIVYFKDRQGRNRVVNKAFEEFVGLSSEKIIGKRDEELLPQGLAVHCYQSDQAVMESRRSLSFEEESACKDGKKVFFDTIKSPLFDASGNVSGVVGVSRDITDRKCHEAQSKLFCSLLNQSSDAIFIIDPETGRFLDINEKACSSLMYSRDEFAGMKVSDIEAVLPDQFVWDAHVRDVKERESIVLTGRHKRKDGTTFPVEVNVKYVKHGDEAYMVAMVRDISDRLENEEKYSALIRSAMDSFWLIDQFGRFLDVNDAACNLLGYTREELLKMGVADIEAIEKPEDVASHIRRVMEAGYDRFETRHKRKDGSIIDAEVSARYIKTKGGRFYAFIRDITERKKEEARKISRLIEEERARAQRLESLGVLAGGIAHDFNNILTGIMGNISFALQFLSPSDNMYNRLAEAEKASLLAQDLTMQLLTFAKGGAPVKKRFNLTAAVIESAEFALRGSNVRSDYNVPDNIKSVEADEGQIRQVIHNLVINSIQAMPQGGAVTIRCENIVVGNESKIGLQNGEYVRVSVEDQGIGIPEEHMNRIFDPFFTTKQSGSGLGLATSYSVIKRHDGLISVHSVLGKGTVFQIYLPASDKSAVSKSVDKGIPVSGTGRVLLMDDDKIIRRLAGDILIYLGYQVDFADSGEDVLDKFQEARNAGKTFDLVIMDLTIPGAMGGKEAIERLLKIDPTVKAIVSSGYSNDPVLADYRKYGFSGVVKKPYRVNEFSQIVHAVINNDLE